MKKCILLLFVLHLLSCNNNTKQKVQNFCQYNIDSLANDIDTSVLLRSVRNNKRIFMDYSTDSSKGTVFNFDSTGNLLSYFFITKDSKYSYSEYFDSHGAIKEIKGTPILLCNLYEQKNDSLLIEFVYSNFRKDIIENTATLNGNSIRLSPVKKCNQYSFAVYSNYKFKKFKGDYTFVSKGKYYDQCRGGYSNFSESTTFKGIQ